MDRLYDKLISYADKDYYPFHMPGHKRNTRQLEMVNPYKVDITEIEGFDNLHKAEGILEELSERISRLYGAGKSFPLINGSTAGILAGICGAAHRGDKVLITRNAHKSVYHAVILMGLEPVYIYPPQLKEFPIDGAVTAQDIEEQLIRSKDIRLVIITSPSYEGVVSDIRGIAEAAHRHGALLFVDEAHGAHLGFHDGFPKSAVSQGADLVVQSLHKTLPSFTQTAVLHSNREDLNNNLQKYLAFYQSSSPSYLLMAGMDRCISMLEDRGKELFQTYHENLAEFYRSMEELKALKLAGRGLVGKGGIYDIDPSKLTISVKASGMTGPMLMKELRNSWHIELEMAAPDYVLGITSICDTSEGFSRLKKALLTVDGRVKISENSAAGEISRRIKPVQALLPWEASGYDTMRVNLKDSAGKVSAVFVSLFPPGAPLIVPGERIEEEMIDYLNQVMQQGITVTGLTGDLMGEIEICAGI